VDVHPKDPDYEGRVRRSFARQAFMATIGATLESVAPGEVVIGLPFDPSLTQQHGFLHAGATTSIADSACGYAALTLMPPGAAVLAVEFKINLLAPASGERFRAVGRVVKPGRTLMVCTGEVTAFGKGGEKAVAIMQATMAVLDRPDLTD